LKEQIASQPTQQQRQEASENTEKIAELTKQLEGSSLSSFPFFLF